MFLGSASIGVLYWLRAVYRCVFGVVAVSIRPTASTAQCGQVWRNSNLKGGVAECYEESGLGSDSGSGSRCGGFNPRSGTGNSLSAADLDGCDVYRQRRNRDIHGTRFVPRPHLSRASIQSDTVDYARIPLVIPRLLGCVVMWLVRSHIALSQRCCDSPNTHVPEDRHASPTIRLQFCHLRLPIC